ncbi:DUF4240 domain-containing protein [Streptomyces clavuligerus]|uniref:DUF4240 domain-containing protein n=1 Tax=Streptomyces clavuligerus TaxID=1901 RepID=UPI0004925260|nr:DUF4240 domain-containing protein [Streptomyces clavuligerus]WDN56113.1 DUF4240 domain-containing protein [Streptomyces clavuligerus]
MNLEKFWELVETCRRQADGRDARLEWLRSDLSRRPLAEIVEFQMCLDQVTHQAFTWELVAAAEMIFGGRCSDDDFCYFGLWMVGLGKDAFGRAVLDPDALADTPEVLRLAGRTWRTWGDDWPGWESLDYVAWEAHQLVTGEPDECGDAFYAAVESRRGEHVVSRGLAGQRWNVRDEAEAARRLPGLSVMFPLSAGA